MGIDSWAEYIAYLKWQGQAVSTEDFKKVRNVENNIRKPGDLMNYISNPRTRLHMQNIKHWWKIAERDKKKCMSLGATVAWPFHPDYPEVFLYALESNPPLMSWIGETCWKNNFLFSVVGSRKPYHDTLLWMDLHLGAFLKNKTSFCLMSGGARGVDQKAHALCLASKKPTLCFLPCGISHFYPQELENWKKTIMDNQGAFVSVFAPDMFTQKHNFHIRNQALACLSHLVFIAQAEVRSGTMVTGRYALHAGVPLCSLPGSPLYSGYKGNLSLIHDGCFLVRDTLDLETLYYSCQNNLVHFSEKSSLSGSNEPVGQQSI